MTGVLVSAGDASGDAHAADWARALRATRPDVRIYGLGGPAMAAAGVELLADQRDLAVGGLSGLARQVVPIARAWRALDRALRERRPSLVVLVDSGAFNLPFARRVRRRGAAPILYYVAPQVWAWRRGRLRVIARRVDRLAVIWPFEPDLYAAAGVRADFVGHPLVDPIEALRARLSPERALETLGLDPGRPWLALLPGSRRNEVRHHLPIQLEVVRRIHARDPRPGFALAVAPSIDAAGVEAAVAGARLPALAEVRVVPGRPRELLRGARAALVKPGTGALEAALLDCPMVVMGRTDPLTAAWVRRAIRVPHYAMPNLIAGREVVPERMQERARPEEIADELAALIDGPARDAQLCALADVRARLGAGGAAARAAAVAEEMLGRA